MIVELPKPFQRKIARIRKKTPFRFDPIPSTLCEYWLTKLNLAELRCLLYISRRTWGFRKDWDAISIDQFCNGVHDRDGKPLDFGVGLKRTHVKNTLRSLETLGLIEVQHRKTKANLYRLAVKPVVTLCDHQLESAGHSM